MRRAPWPDTRRADLAGGRRPPAPLPARRPALSAPGVVGKRPQTRIVLRTAPPPSAVALLAPLLLVATPAAAHGAFGFEAPWTVGALTPAVFPETAAALLALSAFAARQPGRAGWATAAAAGLGVALGGIALLTLRWGFAPGGLAAPVVAGIAGLLALAPPRLPAGATAALAAAGGAALGLSNDLHAPWDYAAWQTVGASAAGMVVTLAVLGALRLVPSKPGPIAAATLGAWAAAAAALGLAFRFAAGG